MTTSAPDSGYWIEVVPYEKAGWAPRRAGTRFRWAWRIQAQHGETCLVGACGGSKENVRQMAEAAIKRLDPAANTEPPPESRFPNDTVL